ncbi:LuxR C-terminal-related transcriptional regulator (plasmid) [Deinococcus taeanensis]|uniref:ATP-binding protein n=1 Tax=Deinococcus taeanensis TaxID=2737050 RepID=UPI001CDCB9A8|nr:LuxR C-terminal-related transcriptional regulator [Deinococcus taeanensis]UBV44138.1 LuxR C-terminal-related transcriptional regulator [Deinococcus taeanensis]
MTPGNERAVVRICQLLEGVPLALELAAAQLRVVAPEGLLAWLERPLEVLTDGPRDGPHHGHSLRSAIRWSADLLTAEQRAVFAACGAFAGSFTLPALEAVTALPQVRRALIGLVDHSLVQPADGPGPRWRLLVPVRDFAAEMLEGHPQARVLRGRHADHYLALAEEFLRCARGYDEEWLARLRADDANLSAALHWLIQTQQASRALRLVRALGAYWDRDATLTHHGWLRQVLALPGVGEEPALLADALCALGLTSRHLQQLEQAQGALEQAGELYRQLGNEAGEADVLLISASVHSQAGDHERALAQFRRVQAIFEGTNNRQRLNDVANNMGVTYLRLGEPADAERCFERTEVLSLELNSEPGLAFARGLLSWSAYLQGKKDVALLRMAAAWAHTLRVPNALLRYTLLSHLAFHARDAGQLELASRLVGCSEAMRAGTGEPWDSCFLPHAQRLDAALRAALGGPYLDWRAQGAAMSFGDIVPEVQDLLTQLAAPASPYRVAPLTRRERDVLELLAQGVPDKKIAQRLHISATTVSKHVSSMLGKLEVHNRVELARWALDHGLTSAAGLRPDAP